MREVIFPRFELRTIKTNFLVKMTKTTKNVKQQRLYQNEQKEVLRLDFVLIWPQNPRAYCQGSQRPLSEFLNKLQLFSIQAGSQIPL